MTSLRLVLVTPRYWPLVGETEHFAADLVQGLRELSVTSTVVTARWAGEWPRAMVLRETPTVRLPQAPLGGWTTYRYLRALSRWLRAHCQEFDVAYIMNLRHDSFAAVGTLLKQPVGVVLRVRAGDCRWLETSLLGGRVRRRAGLADALVAPTQALQRESLAAGFPPDRIHTIPNGVAVAEEVLPAQRHAARASLAEINHSLSAAEYAPIAVAVGPLLEGRNLPELVESWRFVAARWPSAKLWIVGDGSLREPLYERIVDHGLHHQVHLPGTFDDLSDILAAADLFVSPAASLDGGQHLLAAMAAGLPVIAARGSESCELIEHRGTGLILPTADRAELAEAIGELLENPRRAALYGQAGRRRVQCGFSPQQTCQAHLQLFERIAAEKRRRFP